MRVNCLKNFDKITIMCLISLTLLSDPSCVENDHVIVKIIKYCVD